MQFLLSQCQIAWAQNQSLFVTMALAGLVGGFTHCAGMCGPFVLAQTSARQTGAWKRLRGGALIPYHMGRMTTYVGLGVIISAITWPVLQSPLKTQTSAVFLSLAGLIFVLCAWPQGKRWLLSRRILPTQYLGGWIGKLSSPLSGRADMLGRYGLGVLLGFLPCTLVFAALLTTATASNPVVAGLLMVVFTLGTSIALICIGITSQLLRCQWPKHMAIAARGAMAFNGISLWVIAGHLVL